MNFLSSKSPKSKVKVSESCKQSRSDCEQYEGTVEFSYRGCFTSYAGDMADDDFLG